MGTWYLVNKSGMVTLYNKSENNLFFLEKKMGIIVAIKSQRYLSTFCPTAQLHIQGIKQIIFFKLCYIYHYYSHISEVNELHEQHKIMLHNE